MAKYNFLIVGAGIFGATCARLLTDKGYKCLVIDRHDRVGGLASTQTVKDIDIHLYGPHIFNTDDENVWNFVNKYSKFNNYVHTPLVMVDKKTYHLPINMTTFYELFDTQLPAEAYKRVMDETKNIVMKPAENLEEQCLQSFGYTAFNTLIKGYTEKLWGTDCGKLSPEIIAELPVGFSYNNNYFLTKYQGIPTEGYTKLIENMLGDDIDVMLNKDYLADRERLSEIANMTIYTGPIDEFCNYIYGTLDWRTLKIDIRDESDSSNNMLGTSVVNVPNPNNKLLRMVEHKWFTPERNSDNFNDSTIVSYIYADEWTPDKECLYPVISAKSSELFIKYKHFVENNFPNVIFCGRSGAYKLLNMSDSVKIAMGLCEMF